MCGGPKYEYGRVCMAAGFIQLLYLYSAYLIMFPDNLTLGSTHTTGFHKDCSSEPSQSPTTHLTLQDSLVKLSAQPPGCLRQTPEHLSLTFDFFSFKFFTLLTHILLYSHTLSVLTVWSVWMCILQHKTQEHCRQQSHRTSKSPQQTWDVNDDPASFASFASKKRQKYHPWDWS